MRLLGMAFLALLIAVSPAMATVLIVSTVAIFYIGIAPGRIFDAISGLAAALI